MGTKRKCRLCHRLVTPAVADVKVAVSMGLRPIPDITDYLYQAWVNKMPFFSDVFPRDEFLLLFWDPHLAHAE
jgi:hypothetical protein